MEAPTDIWQEGTAPPPSPALWSTLTLMDTFAAVYVLHAVYYVLNRLEGTRSIASFRLEYLLSLGKETVNLAPMLSILFITARMRALQIDPSTGNLQPRAQFGFNTATWSLVILTCTTVLLPLLDKDYELKEGSAEGEIRFVFKTPSLRMVGVVVRYVSMALIFLSADAIMVAIFLLKSEEGPQATPPVAPATLCVIILTSLYFVAYTLVYLSTTAAEFMPNSNAVQKLIDISRAGKQTVMFAPMLSVLFIAARVRALQLTTTVDGKVPPSAGPQSWAQEGMFLATWSVLIQILMTYATTALMGAGTTRSSSEEAKEGKHQGIAKFVDFVNYACMVAMYAGVIAVIVGIAQMTPETLPPYAGYQGLVPGVEVPPPPSPASDA